MRLAAGVLEEGRLRAALTFEQLWVRYFALGGNATLPEIRAFLDGDPQPDHHQYGLLAQALNESLEERDLESVPNWGPADANE